MNRLRRTSQVHAALLGCWTGGGHVRSVYTPEPPLCAGLQVWRWSVREPSWCAKQGAVFISVDPCLRRGKCVCGLPSPWPPPASAGAGCACVVKEQFPVVSRL